MMMEQQFSEMDKIIDGLYLGNIQGASNLPQLKKKGITHILQVAAGFQPFFPGEFQYMVINVLDMPYENLMRHFKSGVDFIKSAIRSGGVVLVHCFAGISRSASVVIAYLMKELGLPMLDALTYTRKRRPIVFPNPGFQKQLFEFEKHLRQNNQKAMVEYQEKKRKRIIEQHNQITSSDQKPRAAASYDGPQKQHSTKGQIEAAKIAYQMYDKNAAKATSSKPQEKPSMSFNATTGKFFTQAKNSEVASPAANRPLTQHADKRGKVRETTIQNDKTPKSGNEARNFDLGGSSDLRVKKLISSTETRAAGMNSQEQYKEAQKIKQQMSQTQAGQILGFQGNVNMESSYKRDFAFKPLELAISMNQKKQTVSNTPTRARETVHERNNNELFRHLPQQQKSTTLIDGKDKAKNQAAVSQQYFYQTQKEKTGRYSDAAVLNDSKKPPLMMIQKTVPQESQNRQVSSTLQTDARRLAALGALPQSYTKQGQNQEHNNIPMHPKLIDPSRKGEIVMTPPPMGLKQHHSSLNNSAGKETTQKLILQEKGGYMLKQLPGQSNSGMGSFDNRNLRDATQRKRY